MKYFGTKRAVETDENEIALSRLSAIASRYRVVPSATDAELPLDFPDMEAEPAARP